MGKSVRNKCVVFSGTAGEAWRRSSVTQFQLKDGGYDGDVGEGCY